MKSEKGQSLVMVGVALFLLAGLCLYLGLSQPKISSGVLVETPTTAVQSGTTTRSAAATVGRSAASSTATAAQTTASGNGCTNHRFRQRGHSQLPGEPEHGYF